jgi:amidase
MRTPRKEPWQLSLVDLARGLRGGRLKTADVVRSCLERIEAVNPSLNAVVQLRREGALRDAKRADRLAPSRRGPLHGVPITIKDSLDTAGIISTGGTKGRAHFVPERDATVVARLRAAGAIVVGKTNTPDLTLSYETNNLVYGRTNNPHDTARTSGGSSGGAAAIVAAHGVPFDIGSDTGGSIRLPAHFCGITGIRPTSGRVPRTGHIVGFDGHVQSLTTIGPLARRVDDLAYVLPLIAGADGIDPHVPPIPLRDHRKVDVRSLRVGYFIELGTLQPTPETAQAVQNSVKTLKRLGCSAKRISIPDGEKIFAMYSGLMFADAGGNVRRALARWGSTESPLLARLATIPADMVDEMTARHEWWDRWRSAMLHLAANLDVIVGPINSGPAPLHDHFDRATAAYTQAFNFAGWPATAVRAGTSPEGLPIGVQCVALPWREDVSLAVARVLEREW